MRRILFLSGFAFWIVSCNSDSPGSGGNPATDSVAPAPNGYSEDKGSGQNKGGSSDPANGGGPQQLNNAAATGGDTMVVAPNTDTAANRRTPAGKNAGGSGN